MIKLLNRFGVVLIILYNVMEFYNFNYGTVSISFVEKILKDNTIDVYTDTIKINFTRAEIDENSNVAYIYYNYQLTNNDTKEITPYSKYVTTKISSNNNFHKLLKENMGESYDNLDITYIEQYKLSSLVYNIVISI